MSSLFLLQKKKKKKILKAEPTFLYTLVLQFSCFAVLAIVLVGLLYGFFIAIICGQKINERHYHVLAKQELTKV